MDEEWSVGPVFTATLVTSALSTAGPMDLVVLQSSAQTRVKIISLEAQQLSTAAQSVQVELWRGSSSTAPAGTAVTPVNLDGWPNTVASKSGVTANTSTIISTASAVRLFAGGFSVGDGSFCYAPEEKHPIITINQTFHARMGTILFSTATPVSVAVTLTYREIGRSPST